MVTLRVGQIHRMRTADPRAPDPVAEGDAVQVAPVFYEQASHGREWELRAVRTGRSRVTVRGADPSTVEVEVQPP